MASPPWRENRRPRFSGFNIGIIYGSLSGLMPVLFVPKAFIVVSAVECVGSLAFGKLSDRVGTNFVIHTSFALAALALYWCSMAGLMAANVDIGSMNVVRRLVGASPLLLCGRF